jgi:hypothetical protein
MSFQITSAFVQQYTTNVEMLLQQKGGKLAPYVMVENFYGKGAKVVEQFGPVKPVKNLARHSDTPLISTPSDARWAYPTDFDWADLIDNQDRLRMLIDPQSPYVMNGVETMRRAQDDVILAAFYATSMTGENGTTSTTFPAGQKVASTVGGAAATGLNISKLRAGKKILQANGVDFETDPIYMVINSADSDNLLNEAQMISLDYNSKPVLVDGAISRFMGVNFVQVEYTDTTAYDSSAVNDISGTRYSPMWAKSGMKLGIWNDVTTSIDRRPDKRNSWQVYITATYGATRLQEKKVVQIASLD